ncbi:MAG: hypothetical protein KGQ41_02035, partial [Alphaproteobacteria bacterium]|nr:hypothetical protein [Alphaproteobacteria bacterium]
EIAAQENTNLRNVPEDTPSFYRGLAVELVSVDDFHIEREKLPEDRISARFGDAALKDNWNRSMDAMLGQVDAYTVIGIIHGVVARVVLAERIMDANAVLDFFFDTIVRKSEASLEAKNFYLDEFKDQMRIHAKAPSEDIYGGIGRVKSIIDGRFIRARAELRGSGGNTPSGTQLTGK